MLEYNVLIDQDVVEAKTASGLYIPEEALERKKHQQTLGVIVKISPMAFSFDDWPMGVAKPRVGDRVAFAQHAGTFIKDAAGKEFRVVKDKDIVAVLDV
jgi:co-chaperonin GroES (HSP10)